MGYYFPSPGDVKNYCNNPNLFGKYTLSKPGESKSLISPVLAAKLDATGNI